MEFPANCPSRPRFELRRPQVARAPRSRRSGCPLISAGTYRPGQTQKTGMAASRTPAATNAFPTGRSHYGNERETKARVGAKANLRAHEGAGNRSMALRPRGRRTRWVQGSPPTRSLESSAPFCTRSAADEFACRAHGANHFLSANAMPCKFLFSS